MKKKIKFPLEMKDGIQVRTIEELKENFDIEKAMGYLLDGKLQAWLSDRYYIQEAEKVGELDVYEPDTENKLYMILGIDNQEKDTGEVDVEAIERRKQKLLKLKQFTDDESIWEKVDLVAFDQEELSDLLDEECKTVYLCGEKFQVPYSVGNISYIGINEPEVFINATGKIDLESKSISLNNVYIQNTGVNSAQDLCQQGIAYLQEKNGKEYSKEHAVKYLRRAGEQGNVYAMAKMVYVFLEDYLYDNIVNGEYWHDDKIKQFERYLWENNIKEMLEKSINLGSSLGKAIKGALLYYGDLLYDKDESDAELLLREALDAGCPEASVWLINVISDHDLEADILKKGIELKDAEAACQYACDIATSEEEERYYKLAVENEDTGNPSRHGTGYFEYAKILIEEKEEEKLGIYYLEKACTEQYKNIEAALMLAKIYNEGEIVKQDFSIANRYLNHALKWYIFQESMRNKDGESISGLLSEIITLLRG